ncbi:hypothetical protein KQX62_11990 [Rhodopseudomonas palustris]|uniref:Replication protein n=1 Tax=Rhodopseudomonas palustris TaxID=1076 RepID=A0AAX3E5H6_RHOPL|nr:hypothetical protein [Rhodopseudomonas palustris]UYO41962.1 hypothetical protein KQX62_11990 [Rhodopseudomonas palustris]
MIALNYASVNNRRRGDISRDGFDRDISVDPGSRPLMTLPAGIDADIDMWGDTTTTAERRSLVSRGNTFLSKTPNDVVNDKNVEVEDDTPLTTTKGRYDLRHGIASILRPDDGTRGPAVCGCGLSGHNVDDVAVHLNENGRAYVSGVYRCDSAWLCPTCAPRRAFEIQDRLTAAARGCIERGGSIWFITPTVRRVHDQHLSAMKAGFQAAWREARQGAGWTKPAKAAGILGLTNVVEAPWSPVTGWGLHGHTLVFFDHCDADRAREACDLLIRRFLDRLPDHGLSGTWSAQDAEECRDAQTAAKYCGKVAAELAHGWVKKGQKLASTSVHAFALAARATMKTPDGEPISVPGLARVSPKRCKDLWQEYAAAMPGTRIGVISAGLAKKLGIARADDDENDGVQQLLEDERIGTIPAPTWNRLVRRALAGTFLSKVETNVDPEDGCGWDEIEAWALDAGKSEKSTEDRHAVVRSIITRNIASKLLNTGETEPRRISNLVEQHIASLRESSHSEAAMPVLRGVLAEYQQMRSQVFDALRTAA